MRFDVGDRVLVHQQLVDSQQMHDAQQVCELVRAYVRPAGYDRPSMPMPTYLPTQAYDRRMASSHVSTDASSMFTNWQSRGAWGGTVERPPSLRALRLRRARPVALGVSTRPREKARRPSHCLGPRAGRLDRAPSGHPSPRWSNSPWCSPRGTSRWCPARVQSVDLLAESYTVRYEDDGGQYDGEYDGRLAPPDGISARAATGGAAVQPTPQQRSRSYGEMQPPALPCMPRAPPLSSVPPPGSFQADPGRKLAAVRVVGDSGEARSDFAGAPVVPGRRRMMAGGYYLTEQSSAGDGHPGACLA